MRGARSIVVAGAPTGVLGQDTQRNSGLRFGQVYLFVMRGWLSRARRAQMAGNIGVDQRNTATEGQLRGVSRISHSRG